MSKNLLSVPLRKTEEVDIKKQLSEVIKKDFFQSSSGFTDDLNGINQLRCQISHLTNGTLQAVKLLEEYILCIDKILKKFPDESCVFSWYNTLGYSLSRKYEYPSLVMEKQNCIFQLGAAYSQLGLDTSKHTSEGLKKSCFYFQKSSGCFQMLANMKYHLMLDFDESTKKALYYLMLAQAQEMVWQKSILDQLKDTAVAKLAMSASELYGKAESLAKISNSLTLEYVNHIGTKKCHFQAVACYRMASASVLMFNYGEQVAYLHETVRILENSKKYRRYVNAIVLEELDGFMQQAKSLLKSAERDNDLIYLKSVPEVIAPIVGVQMAKSIETDLSQSENTGISDNLFNDLIPFFVIQLSQEYKEKSIEFISAQIQKPLHSLNRNYLSVLNKEDLPSSINAIQKPESIPDSIVKHSQHIISAGGLRYLENSFNELETLRVKSKNIVQGCHHILQAESVENKMLRDRHGKDNWNRPLSEESNKELRGRIDKMEAYLNQAKEGDSFVQSKYHQLIPLFKIYEGGKSELSKYIPSSNFIKLDQSFNKIVVDLRSLLEEGEQLMNSRKQFLSELDVKIRDCNFLQYFIESYKENPDESSDFYEILFQEKYKTYLDRYNNDLKYVDKSSFSQKQLENRIIELNQSFREKASTLKELPHCRQQALSNLEAAYAGYLELISNLDEGFDFYNGFITKANHVLRDCDIFVRERRFEGCNLEAKINEQAQQRHQHESPSMESESYGNHLASNSVPENSVSIVVPQGKSRKWNPEQEIRFG